MGQGHETRRRRERRVALVAVAWKFSSAVVRSGSGPWKYLLPQLLSVTYLWKQHKRGPALNKVRALCTHWRWVVPHKYFNCVFRNKAYSGIRYVCIGFSYLSRAILYEGLLAMSLFWKKKKEKVRGGWGEWDYWILRKRVEGGPHSCLQLKMKGDRTSSNGHRSQQ